VTITVSSPITGTAQTGFTAPTYTMVADKAPDVNMNAWIVSALGGTQTGVRIHSVSDPFTLTVMKPKVPRVLPPPNPVTGKYPPPPINRYLVRVRKGANFAANNAPVVAQATFMMDVPAGADAFDAANLRAMISLLVGELNTVSAGIGDTAATGVIG